MADLLAKFVRCAPQREEIQGGQSCQSKFRAYQLVYDTASAIAYLHSRDPPIIHRDLKPENLLLFGDDVKLADFGWSNMNVNMRNTYCGTPDYLAPEMVLRQSHNEKLDVWSLGVLTFELLCGYAPFTPKEVKERNQKMRMMESNITVILPSLTFRKADLSFLLMSHPKLQT